MQNVCKSREGFGSITIASQEELMKLFKRIILGLLLVLFLTGAFIFFVVMPGFIHKTVNRVNGGNANEVSTSAMNLHDTLQIVDLHNDSLLWAYNINQRHTVGHSDVPRLQDGGIKVQVYSTVTQSMMEPKENNTGDSPVLGIQSFAQLQPPSTWFSSFSRGLYQAEKLLDFEKDSDGALKIIRTRSELESLLKEDNKTIGVLLAVEGLHALEGDIKNAKKFFDTGYRIFGLAHFFDNEFAGSSQGMEKHGLTPLGRDFVAYAASEGIILDLAHTSEATIKDVLALAEGPLIVSHTGVKGVCNNARNLSDEIIRGIAKQGGVIGIGFWRKAVCEVSPGAIAKSIRYVADLVGVEYVALGSDYEGSVPTPFDATGLSQLTQALLDEGFSGEEIRLIMGGNAIRVFMETLP